MLFETRPDGATESATGTIRCRDGTENMALLRKLALNMLTHDKSVKIGLKAKGLKAALDPVYLLHVLNL